MVSCFGDCIGLGAWRLVGSEFPIPHDVSRIQSNLVEFSRIESMSECDILTRVCGLEVCRLGGLEALEALDLWDWRIGWCHVSWFA